jgi:hypothetical protein
MSKVVRTHLMLLHLSGSSKPPRRVLSPHGAFRHVITWIGPRDRSEATLVRCTWLASSPFSPTGLTFVNPTDRILGRLGVRLALP